MPHPGPADMLINGPTTAEQHSTATRSPPTPNPTVAASTGDIAECGTVPASAADATACGDRHVVHWSVRDNTANS